MKIGDILREAARRVETAGGPLDDYEFSCIAVHRVAREVTGTRVRGDYIPACQYYNQLSDRRYFRPSDFWNLRMKHEQARDHRVLALCMAATLADEEGL